MVTTAEGLVVCTHLWWRADGPAEGPRATDLHSLHVNRERVLALHPVWVVPGHGPAFVPGNETPR